MLRGSEARHAIAAQRIGVNEIVDVVDGSGTRLRSRVVALRGTDHLECHVEERTIEVVAPIRCTVVQPLIKDAELAVDLMTQVGVDRIIPWQAQHSVVHWRDDRASKGQRKWVNAMQQAAKQSRRANWPVIAPVATTVQVQKLLEEADVSFVLEADAPGYLSEIALPASGTVVIVVGPEGGLSATELTAFDQARFVSLGEQVLRSSLAGAAALMAIRSSSLGGSQHV